MKKRPKPLSEAEEEKFGIIRRKTVKVRDFNSAKFEEDLAKANSYYELVELQETIYPFDKEIIYRIQEKMYIRDGYLEGIVPGNKKDALKWVFDRARQLNQPSDLILEKRIDLVGSLEECDELLDYTKSGTKNRQFLLQKIMEFGNNQD